MKIEEEIKQSKRFPSDHERLIVNILFTASWLEGITIQRLKPYGISPQQFNVLRILRGASPKPVALHVITQRMIDKNSNATRLVEKLRLKGLVKREICATNRRQVDITITNKGYELLAELDKTADQWLKRFEHITMQQITQLNDLLDSIRV
ncbi:MAG: MarR family winged helix-turn-helix transcriptional regulator [Bacteroidota bacterium]|jgi:DNA-binding MarR family transcriptional regulator